MKICRCKKLKSKQENIKFPAIKTINRNFIANWLGVTAKKSDNPTFNVACNFIFTKRLVYKIELNVIFPIFSRMCMMRDEIKVNILCNCLMIFNTILYVL